MQFMTAYIEGRIQDPTEAKEGVRVVPWWLCFTHIDYERRSPSELFKLTEGRYLGWGHLDPLLLTDSSPGDVLVFPWSSQIHIDNNVMDTQEPYNGGDYYNDVGPHAQAILVRRASVVLTNSPYNGYHVVAEVEAAKSQPAVFLRIQADPDMWATTDEVYDVTHDTPDNARFGINTQLTDEDVLVLGLDCAILKPGESVYYALGVPAEDGEDSDEDGERAGERTINVRFHFDGIQIQWQVDDGPLFDSPPLRLEGPIIP